MMWTRCLCLALALLAMPGCKAVSKNVTIGMQRLEKLTRSPMDGPYHLVFTSFRPETDYVGLYLLYSRNGYSWMPLNEDRPVFSDPQGGLRDPHLERGPDGTWHMVWTGGGKQEIRYASSPDLVTWSAPRRLAVMASEPGCENSWAPELFYDAGAGEWIIHWSSTVAGRFEDTVHEGDGNHRIYYTTTRDFRTLAPPQILFNPGYNVIDATIAFLDGRYLLFFKDERVNPWKKHILYAVCDSPRGPWRDITRTVEIQWIEGPSVIRLGRETIVYYDFYAKGRYGGMVSRDMKTWTDKTEAMEFPPGHRHGTVVRVDSETAERLLALKPGA